MVTALAGLRNRIPSVKPWIAVAFVVAVTLVSYYGYQGYRFYTASGELDNATRSVAQLNEEGRLRGQRPLDRFQPELPISSCLGPSKVPSSTRAIVVSLTDAVNHPIKLTEPFSRRGELAFDGQRRWLSPRLHSLQTPPGTHLALGCLSSPLMTSRIIATLVLDAARRYAPTLAGISPGTLPPQQAETPTSWHAAPDVHPS